MKHIVQFSGGKDSTAMLLMMLNNNMPVDDIVFCDTGKEFPAMYDHIAAVEKLIGRKVTVLKAEYSFDHYFLNHKRTKGKNIGVKGYGWASMRIRWCTKALKVKPTSDYLKNQGDYTLYIGIAADEPKRHKNIAKNVIHPLFDWGITESMALEYCYNRGFDWNGLYKDFRRVSCYLCPLQRIGDWRLLRKKYPELYADALRLDRLNPLKEDQLKKGWFSLEKLERRFANEERQQSLFQIISL